MQNFLRSFKALLQSGFFRNRSSCRTSSASRFVFTALIFCLALVPARASSDYQFADSLDMPVEYGEVIFQINENSPKQLYIIGISHRDPESGRNSSTTIKTQADIFRIGEWLNRNRKLQLLLPEGYFSDKKTIAAALPHPAKNVETVSSPQLEYSALCQQLADESRFINAEMLLMENFSMRASQVEDKKIYDAVRSSLRNLKATGAAKLTPEERLAELQFLQEVRTAALLQNIPAVIDNEHTTGAIGNQSAMFTIGLNHIHDIVKYFQDDAIRIVAPLPGRMQVPSLEAKLNLLKTGYGVTIIIPRTLADNRELLQMTNIDSILVAADSQLEE